MMEERMTWTLEQVEAGLRGVRNDLAQGTISATQFKMDTVFEPSKIHPSTPCGSVGCIGGWMVHKRRIAEGLPIAMITNLTTVIRDVQTQTQNVERGNGLDHLFFGWTDGANVDDGIRAIDNWLGGDNDPWRTA